MDNQEQEFSGKILPLETTYGKTQKSRSMEIMKKYIRVGEPEVVEVGYDFIAKETQRKPYASLTGMRVAIDDLATTNPAS